MCRGLWESMENVGGYKAVLSPQARSRGIHGMIERDKTPTQSMLKEAECGLVPRMV